MDLAIARQRFPPELKENLIRKGQHRSNKRVYEEPPAYRVPLPGAPHSPKTFESQMPQLKEMVVPRRKRKSPTVHSTLLLKQFFQGLFSQ